MICSEYAWYVLYYFSCLIAPQLDFILKSDLILSFDASTKRQCFDVVIVADNEQDEEFFIVALSLIQFLPGLSVDPARGTAHITIVPITTAEREQFFHLLFKVNVIILLFLPPP